MPRFAPIPEELMTRDQRRMAAKASKTGPYHAFLRAPRLWEALQEVRKQIGSESSLSQQLSELIILAVATHWKAKIAISAHSAIARDVGVATEVIARIVAGNSCADLLAPKDAIALDFADILLRKTRADDVCFARARDSLGETALVEIAGIIGFFTTICLVLNLTEEE